MLWYRVSKNAMHLWDNKTEVQLGAGTTLIEAEKAAYTFWGSRMALSNTLYTLRDLINRYTLNVLPTKETSQRESNTYSLARITKVLDLDQPVIQFKPHHAYQYRDGIHLNNSANCANKDIETLSHIFTKAIEWGCEMTHPIKGIMKKLPTPANERYVYDDELDWFLSVSNRFLNVYCPLKLATGKDQIMLLKLQLSDITEHGINFGKRQKTGAGKASFLPFEYEGQSTGLLEIIKDIMAWRKDYLKPGVSSLYLFCSQVGNPMFNQKTGKTSAFKSQWKRAMDLALEKTNLSERFTEHDLRAKTASDIDNDIEASKLLGHASVATTRKIYIRKPQTVIPFQRKNLPQ